jgi:hypothetical protein
VEYSKRINQQYRIPMMFVPASIIHHPRTVYQTKTIWGKEFLYVKSNAAHGYYDLRNNIFILFKYNNNITAFYRTIRKLLCAIFFIFFFQQDKPFLRFKYYLCAAYDGATGKLGKREFARV